MRLFRHLTFSNVIALLALFVALGGAAYAGSKINGQSIVNKSIGGGKLKNETITANKIKKGTITSAQIAPGSIDSTQINISTLTTVPSAQTATTATTATSATTATTAKTAETATKATSAISADEAGEADTATSADSAKHAGEADRATIAGEAEKLGGKTATQLTLSCQTGTKFYGGMCWDETSREPEGWLEAVKICGDAGGRLPTIAELIAYVSQNGIQVTGLVWSGDVVALGPSSEEEVLISDENGRATSKSGLLRYRCVFPRSNG
jgi:hypothetical protein